MSEMLHRNLHHSGLVRYHNHAGHFESRAGPGLTRKLQGQSTCDLPLIQVNQHPRHNTELRHLPQEVQQRYLEFASVPAMYHPDTLADADWHRCTRWHQHELQQALITVSLETTVSMPRPFLSRITMKAIVHHRPFVVLASPGLLAFLRDLGFQTFEDFWDESYDREADVVKRAHAILDVLENYRGMSADQCQQQLARMKSVLVHNHRHFFAEFGPKLIADLQQIR